MCYKIIRDHHQRWQQKKICLDEDTYFSLLWRGQTWQVTCSVQHHYTRGLTVQSSEHPGLTEAASSTGWTQWFHSCLPNLITTNFLNKFDSNFSKLLMHNAWSRVFGSHNKIFIANTAICNYIAKFYCNVISLCNHKKKVSVSSSGVGFFWFFFFFFGCRCWVFFYQIVRFPLSFEGCFLTVLLLISANTPCFL